MSPSMIVDDLDVLGAGRRPAKANTELIVHANAALPGAIALECFQPIARRAGNIALLKIAAGLDLIPVKSAEHCRTAYREFRRMPCPLRLNGAQYARVSLE